MGQWGYSGEQSARAYGLDFGGVDEQNVRDNIIMSHNK